MGRLQSWCRSLWASLWQDPQHNNFENCLTWKLWSSHLPSLDKKRNRAETRSKVPSLGHVQKPSFDIAPLIFKKNTTPLIVTSLSYLPWPGPDMVFSPFEVDEGPNFRTSRRTMDQNKAPMLATQVPTSQSKSSELSSLLGKSTIRWARSGFLSSNNMLGGLAWLGLSGIHCPHICPKWLTNAQMELRDFSIARPALLWFKHINKFVLSCTLCKVWPIRLRDHHATNAARDVIMYELHLCNNSNLTEPKKITTTPLKMTT